MLTGNLVTTDLITAAAVLYAAYVIRGVSGFGSGLVAVPLLAHFMPLTVVTPLIIALDFIASLFIGTNNLKAVAWGEVRRLLPFALIGVVLGTTLLLELPKTPLLATLGAFVVLFGLRNLLVRPGDSPISAGWAAPAGFAGGAIGALFGTGGPPYIIYLTHRLRDKTAVRTTFSGLYILDGGFRLVVFAMTGILFDARLGLLLLLALPVMALGLWTGSQLHVRLSPRQMTALIGLLLIGSGGSLLVRALT